jgi:hypothetical protein
MSGKYYNFSIDSCAQDIAGITVEKRANIAIYTKNHNNNNIFL